MADVIAHTASAPAALKRPADEQSQLHWTLPVQTGFLGSCLMIFKAIVGAGLFALPYAFSKVGVGGALVLSAVIATLTFYSGQVLIRVHDVAARDTLRRNLTYTDLARHCFGPSAGVVVYGLLVFCSIGSQGAYLIFIGKVLHSLWPALSTQAYAGLVACALTPFVLLRDVSALRWTSLLGNLGVALVVATTLARGAQVGTLAPADQYAWFKPSGFMESFGVIGFLYSCSTSLITIEKSMAHRAQFATAYAATSVFVFVACSAFAAVLALLFADCTRDMIVLNLGSGQLAETAKLAIVLDLAFSYPLSGAAAREIVEKSLLTNASPHVEAKRTAIRVAMVATSFLVSFVPSFSTVLNIVGGWSVSALSFTLPCLMLIQLRRLHLRAYAAQQQFLSDRLLAQGAAAGGTPQQAQQQGTPPRHTRDAADLRDGAAPVGGGGGRGPQQQQAVDLDATPPPDAGALREMANAVTRGHSSLVAAHASSSHGGLAHAVGASLKGGSVAGFPVDGPLTSDAPPPGDKNGVLAGQQQQLEAGALPPPAHWTKVVHGPQHAGSHRAIPAELLALGATPRYHFKPLAWDHVRGELQTPHHVGAGPSPAEEEDEPAEEDESAAPPRQPVGQPSQPPPSSAAAAAAAHVGETPEDPLAQRSTSLTSVAAWLQAHLPHSPHLPTLFPLWGRAGGGATRAHAAAAASPSPSPLTLGRLFLWRSGGSDRSPSAGATPDSSPCPDTDTPVAAAGSAPPSRAAASSSPAHPAAGLRHFRSAQAATAVAAKRGGGASGSGGGVHADATPGHQAATDVVLHGHRLHHLPRTRSDYGIHAAGPTKEGGAPDVTDVELTRAGLPQPQPAHPHAVAAPPGGAVCRAHAALHGAPQRADEHGGPHQHPPPAHHHKGHGHHDHGHHDHGHGHHHHGHKALFAWVRRHRHQTALQLLGVGTTAETAALCLVALFGAVVLVMTTVVSIQQAVNAGSSGSALPATCPAL